MSRHSLKRTGSVGADAQFAYVQRIRASYGRLNCRVWRNSIGNTVPGQSDISGALTRITSTILRPSSDLVRRPNFAAGPNREYLPVAGQLELLPRPHSWKAGVNFTYQRSPNAFLPVVNGSYRFGDASLSTPSVFDYQFLAQNVPNRIQIASGDPSLDFREKIPSSILETTLRSE